MYFIDPVHNTSEEFVCSVSGMTRTLHNKIHFSDKAFWLQSYDEHAEFLDDIKRNKNVLLRYEHEEFFRFRNLPIRVYY